MSLNDALHWRYAPKRMNGQKVSEANIEAILKAAQYAPTSMGLQPFTLYLIEPQEMREQIKPIAYNQPQITESSHLLLFASYTKLTQQHIDTYLQNIIETRGVTSESLVPFRNSMLRFAETSSDEQIKNWSSNQVYISLGFAIAEAALLGVDATPMEGFDCAGMDNFLKLHEIHHTSVALLAIGYRDADNDFLANEKKIRRPLDQLVVRIS
ncbi:MAG: nitroreductase family protein [Chitinophagaceae bacterium]|jgi:nitroreductase